MDEKDRLQSPSKAHALQIARRSLRQTLRCAHSPHSELKSGKPLRASLMEEFQSSYVRAWDWILTKFYVSTSYPSQNRPEHVFFLEMKM